MELAEVKKYFENAEFVESVSFNEKRKVDLDSIWVDFGGDYFCTEKETGYIFCLGSKKRGFAKILTTKEPSFSITKDQLRQLTDPKVKEWFPEVFSLPKDFTGWAKTSYRGNKKYLVFFKEGVLQYGFNVNGTWSDYGEFHFKVAKNEIEATNEEVFNALKIEAVRRGFVEGVRITPMFYNGKDYYPDKNIISSPLNFKLKGNVFVVDGGLDEYRIFVNGKWATVIEIKKSEAEKLLNKKIID